MGMTMEWRSLGQHGPKVSAIGLGCMSMSGSYGPADEAEAEATIGRAVELGVTLFDTGDFYGGGHNERLLGRALARTRDDVTIATKTGVRRGPDGLVSDASPAYLRQACDASLERLGVDQIDLWYLARRDPNVPVEESVGAMAEMVDAGKVRAIGLSEVSAGTLRRAHAIHPIAALQTEYSLWQRHVEAEILPTARDLGIGFVAYSPLGRGLLSGGVRSASELPEGDFRRSSPRFQGNNLTLNLTLVDQVKALAADKGVTAAQLAIAWVLAQGEDIVPIPGTKRHEYLEQNLAAAEIDLTPRDLELLDGLEAAGARYPEALMRDVEA
jgi:aryl-alcohol dehydrogenase-like predicted oxidoreductase